MKLVTFYPEAYVEVVDALRYYESRSPGLGFALGEEVGEALTLIAGNPEAYQPIKGQARRKPLWRFPYNIIYAPFPDQIWIVAFAHQKRRPFYWRNRLNA